MPEEQAPEDAIQTEEVECLKAMHSIWQQREMYTRAWPERSMVEQLLHLACHTDSISTTGKHHDDFVNARGLAGV